MASTVLPFVGIYYLADALCVSSVSFLSILIISMYIKFA